jgi:hypothetical protein
MQTILHRLLLLLLLAAAGLAAEAEESGDETLAAQIDELEPGLSRQDLSAERAAIEPGLSSAELLLAGQRTETLAPTAVLAQDVRRRTTGNRVMDEMELGRTEITGNQELPKVLYIVPWRKSDPGDLTGKPVNTLLDEVLAPIDRSEFIRQVDYYHDLYGKDEN